MWYFFSIKNNVTTSWGSSFDIVLLRDKKHAYFTYAIDLVKSNQTDKSEKLTWYATSVHMQINKLINKYFF